MTRLDACLRKRRCERVGKVGQVHIDSPHRPWFTTVGTGSALGSVGAGWPASISVSQTSAHSTPLGRARRVGVDSSLRRSVCVSRCLACTSV